MSAFFGKLKRNIPRWLCWLGVSALFVALDQVTKKIAAANLPDNPKPDFIPYIFNLVYVENRGAAWGLFADQRWVFILVSSVAIFAVAFEMLNYAKSSKLLLLSLAMILAGGIGNMIDRVAYGYVVDFLQFSFFESFPVFNGADSFVTVGAVMMIIYILTDKSLFKETPKNPEVTDVGSDENGGGQTGA